MQIQNARPGVPENDSPFVGPGLPACRRASARRAASEAGNSRTVSVLATLALLLLVALTIAPALAPVHAQNRMTFSKASTSSGHIALGLAVRKLSVSGTFLQAPAHPDDETNALFTYFGYGQGLRVIDVQNNRGDGGQNEIGPELFRDIAVLRTSELLSAHRIDGAEQYFTRAIDYGYSFDPEEVINKWGRKDIVGDYVRLWRTLRPDVIVTMNIQGRGGDRAHEATTILVRESFRAAGDSNMYPEQIVEGLRPWQPKKLYFAGAPFVPGEPGAAGGGRGGRGRGAQGADAAKLTPVPTDSYDELLGRTYAEIASDATGRWARRRSRASYTRSGRSRERTWRRGSGPSRTRPRRLWRIWRRPRLFAGRYNSSRPDGQTGIGSLRRHRYQPYFHRAVRRAESAVRAHRWARCDFG
jgi:LmbE family N-acetylglucosaminyl deacetylase